MTPLPESTTLSLDEALMWVRRAYETGYQHGRAKSRVIATNDGLIDGSDAVADIVRESIESSRKDGSSPQNHELAA